MEQTATLCMYPEHDINCLRVEITVTKVLVKAVMCLDVQFSFVHCDFINILDS